ncbi:MAG: hypothetical protein A2133_02270 [Actinobacteria bacterium RBG_16_64_13]|nr:MAG: hypothetical protein A2133_02270 [Actinobacteria bacterium RBG_16_64_13]
MISGVADPGAKRGAAAPSGDDHPPDCGVPAVDFRSLEEVPAYEVAQRLALKPHREGGYFRETYRSPVEVATDAGPRPVSTAILYLLTQSDPSRLHRLRRDELWFYHAGAPAELVLLAPPLVKRIEDAPAAPGAGLDPQPFTTQVIGLDRPQAVVPAYYWAAARVLTEDQTDWGTGRAPERRWTADRRAAPELHWTLVSCVVSPGFEYEDFELADRKTLLRQFPQARAVIKALT